MEALMLTLEELAVHMQLEIQTVRGWVEEGWLVSREATDLIFSDVDLARAQLIVDLKEDIGVNDEGVGIILDLLDQVHGLRNALRTVGQTLVATGALAR
jgi:chaperone modulatory protein CbpM